MPNLYGDPLSVDRIANGRPRQAIDHPMNTPPAGAVPCLRVARPMNAPPARRFRPDGNPGLKAEFDPIGGRSCWPASNAQAQDPLRWETMQLERQVKVALDESRLLICLWRLEKGSARRAVGMAGPARVVCREHRRSKRRCVTVREMKEAPSRPAVRFWPRLCENRVGGAQLGA
jgi:hypothetical protein